MLEYKMDFYQNMLTLAIFFIGYIIVFLIGVKQKKDIAKVTLLYMWHTLFSFVYYLISLSNVSDATVNYIHSLSLGAFEFYPGSPFVKLVASFFSKGLNASYALLL